MKITVFFWVIFAVQTIVAENRKQWLSKQQVMLQCDMLCGKYSFSLE